MAGESGCVRQQSENIPPVPWRTRVPLNIACSGHEHFHFMGLSVSFTKTRWNFFLYSHCFFFFFCTEKAQNIQLFAEKGFSLVQAAFPLGRVENYKISLVLWLGRFLLCRFLPSHELGSGAW